MNRVELWIDPVSEDEQSFHSILHHTSICVEFEKNVKYLFSYNEDGLSCLPAAGEPEPKDKVHLGYTYKDLLEVMDYAYKLQKDEFKKYAAIGKNCNHFCNKLSLWMCNKQIPDKYLGQDVSLVGAAGIAGIVAIGAFKLLGALLRR